MKKKSDDKRNEKSGKPAKSKKTDKPEKPIKHKKAGKEEKPEKSKLDSDKSGKKMDPEAAKKLAKPIVEETTDSKKTGNIPVSKIAKGVKDPEKPIQKPIPKLEKPIRKARPKVPKEPEQPVAPKKIVTYKRNKKTITQRAGGFDSERTRTEDRYASTRQRRTEFGGCSKIATSLHSALKFSHLFTIPDPKPGEYVYNHIQRGMLKIKECDIVSPKGEKTVSKGLKTENGRKLLEEFSFSRTQQIADVLFSPYSVALSDGCFSIKNFAPYTQLYFPRERDMVGMQFILLRIDLESYEAECFSSMSAISVFSRKASLNADPIDVVLEADLPEGDGMLVGVLFVGACEKVGEGYRWYKNKWCVMGVVGIE